ncbi:hypothetical protein [Cupriavidus sp. BIS7]|uniref:hypothetical protein n=1 Tax=Cupriavidus sp. BIS7 TaxID=1217718 RepID=UPI00030969FC|nr:hypothetical protein [Cupriavidus sp. BIS7]
MSKFQVAAPWRPVTAGQQSAVSRIDVPAVHRLRAVVATYRTALQAYTLVVSPDELMALSNGREPSHSARDYRAQAHLDRLLASVRGSGLALPSAIVVAVSGGRMQCECDHLYTLEMHPQAGDSLIVLDGYDRLAALAESGRGNIKTLVTAVLCCTAIDGTEATSATSATGATGSDHVPMHTSAAARWAGATRIWQ